MSPEQLSAWLFDRHVAELLLCGLEDVQFRISDLKDKCFPSEKPPLHLDNPAHIY